MKKKVKQLVAGALVLSQMVAFSGCGKKNSTDTSNTPAKENGSNETTDGGQTASGEIDHSETITLDVFSSQSNYQGIETGWFAKLVKDKFNIELNIISPNVAGGGDTLYTTRSAEGNLGDIVFIDRSRMKDCVESGIILDVSDYYENSTYLKTFDISIQATKEYIGADGIYGLSGGSTSPATEPVFENQSPYVGTFMRLDYYNELGNPTIKDTDDMLNVLKQMQDAHPTTDDGKPVYAFSLFGDWDGTYMALAGKYAYLYGYEEGKAAGVLFPNADASDYSEIVADDGVYHRALQMFFDANQMGLVDPDSVSQDWDTTYTKMCNGQTLFSFWPWLAAGYNTTENKEAGKGFAFIPVEDQQLVNDGYNRYDSNLNLVCGIGANTKYPDRVFEFVDWLASPEYTYCTPQSNAGMEGVNWELVDGKPVLTEFGLQCYNDPNTIMPDDLGGGSYTDGRAQLAFYFVSPTSYDPATGEKYSVADWTSVLESTKTKLDDMYLETFGANNAAEYLTNNNLVQVFPGSNYFAPAESTDIATERSQCGDLVTRTSWQMIFAADQAEFDALWANMKEQLDGLGYQDVLAADLAKIASMNAEIKEAVAAENN